MDKFTIDIGIIPNSTYDYGTYVGYQGYSWKKIKYNIKYQNKYFDDLHQCILNRIKTHLDTYNNGRFYPHVILFMFDATNPQQKQCMRCINFEQIKCIVCNYMKIVYSIDKDVKITISLPFSYINGRNYNLSFEYNDINLLQNKFGILSPTEYIISTFKHINRQIPCNIKEFNSDTIHFEYSNMLSTLVHASG